MQDNQKQAVPIAYFAGIIDGEGWIIVRRNKGIGQYSFEIGVGMVSKQVIDALQEQFGGNIYEERVPNRRSIWRWKVLNQPAILNCIEQVGPYLMVKHVQAALMAKEIKTRVVRKNNERAIKLSDTEIQRREDFYQMVRKLNAVGAAATTNREDT